MKRGFTQSTSAHLLLNAIVIVPNHQQEASNVGGAVRAGDHSPSRVHQGRITVSGSGLLSVVESDGAVAAFRSALS